MAASVLGSVTKPYSFFESLAYDRMIAPAVVSMASDLEADMIARVPQNAQVLDVGCGGGHLLELIAMRRPDLTLTGVDLSADQVRRARRRLRRFAERVTIEEGSALDLRFEANSFDGVFSMASIKHWPDQLQGLRECLRVLQPGGRLMVVEADRGCRLDDVKTFVERWKLPKAIATLPLAVFRTWVAGHSIDLDDARALVEQLDLANVVVARVEGTPALKMEGEKI